MMDKKYTVAPDKVVAPPTGAGSLSYVVVFMSHKRFGSLRNFRCTNCGLLVFQYDDTIQAISDGGELPPIASFFDKMCPRCKFVFRIV